MKSLHTMLAALAVGTPLLFTTPPVRARSVEAVPSVPAPAKPDNSAFSWAGLAGGPGHTVIGEAHGFVSGGVHFGGPIYAALAVNVGVPVVPSNDTCIVGGYQVMAFSGDAEPDAPARREVATLAFD